ncbi:MAG: uracil-DNA glycosylase family protein [Alteromonadaceae bacterium TMED7]|nr:IclR family transcriptional regulator [Alteromonadaceae bacterium]MCP4865868.1 uracil-DNA glycosylase family protein [Alteromonas sp.]RPH17903.1 MAG: uracil-DNA glycosylase family protein [Alteromonadaceae bacterium TMED7]|tara:strand:- start:9218 stop:9793 length:576 start_codon:yes stop_codon:yes gene_type:complete
MTRPADSLLAEIRSCTLCADNLPYPPRPIVQIETQARILIIGQAPGIKAHDSSQPWNDASGDKLRGWLGVNRQQFYSPAFSHLPIAFCFPGYKNGADAPPPKTCAVTWHAKVQAQLKPALTLYIGRYAQQYYLPEYKTLTEAVRLTTQSSGNAYSLPHPSGRNNRWQARNPWFEAHSLEVLRHSVAGVLRG